MGVPETPVPSQADRIEQRQADLEARVDALIAAFNATGANVQWIVDNVKGIFELFGNPAMMGMMSGMMQGGIPNLTGMTDEPAIDGAILPK